MNSFDFTNLADLDLDIHQMTAINEIFSKQRVNVSYWAESPQLFIENFVRCLWSAIPCNAVPSVVAAQAILESGWFSTDSLFGVKATKLQLSQGQGTQQATHEVVNGTSVPTVGTFFENPSIQNCFANYYDYVARMKPNSSQFLPDNARGYLAYLQNEPAYSTAGQGYISSIMSVINSSGLTAFDKT